MEKKLSILGGCEEFSLPKSSELATMSLLEVVKSQEQDATTIVTKLT